MNILLLPICEISKDVFAVEIWVETTSVDVTARYRSPHRMTVGMNRQNLRL